MNGKIMKDFLENRMYKKICDSINKQETTINEVLDVIIFCRIDKKLGRKFINLMEKEKLLEIVDGHKVIFKKGFDNKVNFPIEKRNIKDKLIQEL